MEVRNPGGARRIATGTYAGDNGDDRDIATGFQCALVILMCAHGAASCAILQPLEVISFAAAVKAGGTQIHATDGFTVYQTADGLNLLGQDYFYFAIQAD